MISFKLFISLLMNLLLQEAFKFRFGVIFDPWCYFNTVTEILSSIFVLEADASFGKFT